MLIADLCFRLEDLSISNFEQKTHFWGSWKFFSFRKILILKNSAQEWALERQGFGLSYLISLFCFIRAATVSRKLSNWIPHNSISLNFYHFSSSWNDMPFIDEKWIKITFDWKMFFCCEMMVVSSSFNDRFQSKTAFLCRTIGIWLFWQTFEKVDISMHGS